MKILLPSPLLPENNTVNKTENEFKPSGFSPAARMNSFIYAGRGIYRFFLNEPNARFHLAATLAVIFLSFYFGVSRTEIMALVFCIALVWLTEMINTSIEKAMDFIYPERHPQIALIKDIAAGAVLIAACCALVIGLIIFIPKLHFV